MGRTRPREARRFAQVAQKLLLEQELEPAGRAWETQGLGLHLLPHQDAELLRNLFRTVFSFS